MAGPGPAEGTSQILGPEDAVGPGKALGFLGGSAVDGGPAACPVRPGTGARQRARWPGTDLGVIDLRAVDLRDKRPAQTA